ncbi:hypothetical protein GLAREA_03561 [Glarea lozoyensis ATCC 20868]|uniref:Uncharacterized protein n=1 Tax=Glarea lozoyensis (strain ATCC 20868 / MF5171) TaxID=1116229 RepID=S3D0A2_GLAL2|nr:uncharacterized protein GLAREA_03561 [Glarea lozoyensis ATCC 20868]EPE30594.1 hypothetical protein GLAREA_03561 [Glarea lozoyensis ATCC 20868]
MVFEFSKFYSVLIARLFLFLLFLTNVAVCRPQGTDEFTNEGQKFEKKRTAITAKHVHKAQIPEEVIVSVVIASFVIVAASIMFVMHVGKLQEREAERREMRELQRKVNAGGKRFS